MTLALEIPNIYIDGIDKSVLALDNAADNINLYIHVDYKLNRKILIFFILI